MPTAINVPNSWALAFLVLFLIVMAYETGFANPDGMLAPWPFGVTYRCNQGNFGSFSRNIPYTYYAWDFSLPTGSPVVAAADGQVILVGNNYRDGYGNQVRIRHRNGSISLYAHLDAISVGFGSAVICGQLIGFSGATGYATGPHLHFSIIDQSNYSLPSRFSDIGVPVEGGYYTSCNSLQAKGSL